jgi:hypothetical protein
MREKIMSLLDLIDPSMLDPEPLDPRYIGSPFQHIKVMGAKQKGKRYENITRDLYSKLGYTTTKPVKEPGQKKVPTDYDALVDGVKTEIKGSTLNKGTDHFSFLQIRPAQDYAKVAFAMFYPQEVVIMEMSKELVFQAIKDGHFKPQHGGQKGESGTFTYYGEKESLAALGATVLQPK